MKTSIDIFFEIAGLRRDKSDKVVNLNRSIKTPLIAVAAFAMAASAQSAQASTRHAAHPVTGWQYKQQKDEMRGTVTRYAWVPSKNVLRFPFPYSGGSTGRLELRDRAQDGFQVLLFVSPGQFTCAADDDKVAVKFDDGPIVKYACSGSDDGVSNLIFIDPSDQFLDALRHSSTVIVEAEFFQAGSQQLKFDVSGLKWVKRDPVPEGNGDGGQQEP